MTLKYGSVLIFDQVMTGFRVALGGAQALYGIKPDRWSDSLAGWDRLRVIVNAMTRLCFCTEDGVMDLKAKGEEAPPGYAPWFQFRPPGEARIVVGHWSALGLRRTARLAAIDTGCVWGGSLTALRLEDDQLFQVNSNGYQEVRHD